MKKLTLNQAWKLCLQQWKWISGELDKGVRIGIWRLKDKWLEAHEYEEINCSCFFCQYDAQYKGGCESCPAKRIDLNFDCCEVPSFGSNPRLFYKKLLSLNRKRLRSKK